jgi:adenylate kinase
MNILVSLAFECWVQAARLFSWKRRNALYVVLLGGPGAGKGTIAARLCPLYGIPHLSTGNLIRREIAEQTEIGKEWGPAIAAGQLVPDSVMLKLLKRELSKPEYYRGAILDGFPRTVNQATMLRNMLACWGNQVDIAIFLDVSEDDLLERLSLRRTCKNTSCARTYHLRYSPPAAEGICDVCGSPLYQRADERPEAVVVRMREFKRTFEPLRQWFAQRRLLVTIRSSNEMGIDKVFEEVVFAVDEVD